MSKSCSFACHFRSNACLSSVQIPAFNSFLVNFYMTAHDSLTPVDVTFTLQRARFICSQLLGKESWTLGETFNYLLDDILQFCPIGSFPFCTLTSKQLNSIGATGEFFNICRCILNPLGSKLARKYDDINQYLSDHSNIKKDATSYVLILDDIPQEEQPLPMPIEKYEEICNTLTKCNASWLPDEHYPKQWRTIELSVPRHVKLLLSFETAPSTWLKFFSNCPACQGSHFFKDMNSWRSNSIKTLDPHQILRILRQDDHKHLQILSNHYSWLDSQNEEPPVEKVATTEGDLPLPKDKSSPFPLQGSSFTPAMQLLIRHDLINKYLSLKPISGEEMARLYGHWENHARKAHDVLEEIFRNDPFYAGTKNPLFQHLDIEEDLHFLVRHLTAHSERGDPKYIEDAINTLTEMRLSQTPEALAFLYLKARFGEDLNLKKIREFDEATVEKANKTKPWLPIYELSLLLSLVNRPRTNYVVAHPVLSSLLSEPRGKFSLKPVLPADPKAEIFTQDRELNFIYPTKKTTIN